MPANNLDSIPEPENFEDFSGFKDGENLISPKLGQDSEGVISSQKKVESEGVRNFEKVPSAYPDEQKVEQHKAVQFREQSLSHATKDSQKTIEDLREFKERSGGFDLTPGSEKPMPLVEDYPKAMNLKIGAEDTNGPQLLQHGDGNLGEKQNTSAGNNAFQLTEKQDDSAPIIEPGTSEGKAKANYAQRDENVSNQPEVKSNPVDTATNSGASQTKQFKASIQNNEVVEARDIDQYVAENEIPGQLPQGHGDQFSQYSQQSDGALPGQPSEQQIIEKYGKLAKHSYDGQQSGAVEGGLTPDNKTPGPTKHNGPKRVGNEVSPLLDTTDKTGKQLQEGRLETTKADDTAVKNEKKGAAEKGVVAEIHKPAEGSRAQPDKHEPYSGKEQEPTKTRPDKLIDSKTEAGKSPLENEGKHGSKLDIRIDGKGKRIGLDGKEILVWDGKNSPLYPGQKGKRVTRFIDPVKGVGKGAKGKFGDPKADLSPTERAQIDKVIKETDRIFFGEKKQTTKGKSKAGRGTKDSATGKRGDSNAITGGSSKDAPFPGLRLPEFKIRWPGRKQPQGDDKVKIQDSKFGDKTGKTGKGAVRDGIKTADSSKPGSARIESRRSDLESNIKSINRSIGKLLSSEREVKLVRTLPTRSEGSPAGRVAKTNQPKEFQPVKIGTRPHVETKSGQDARAPKTFIPSPIAIQPIDWSALKGWMEIRGVFRGGKRRVADRIPKGKSDTKPVANDSTKTVKSDTKTVLTESTKTVNTSDKTQAKSDSSKGKSKGEPVSRIVDKKGKSRSDAKSKGQKFELKESEDAFGGKLPSIKMTYKPNMGDTRTFTGSKVESAKEDAKTESAKQTKEAAKRIDRDLKPINTAKAGQAKIEPMTPRAMKDLQSNLNALDVDPKSTKSAKPESESKPKIEGEKGKLVLEVKDGKIILRDLLLSSKGGFSRRSDRILDGARVIAGKDILSMYIGIEQAKGASIREVLAGLKVGGVKKNFVPEITESGTYKITRSNQSSAQIMAFASSAKHNSLLFGAESSDERLRAWQTTLKERDELETTLQEERRAEAESNVHQSKSLGSEDVRKSYFVQEGDTPESIAVVQLNDSSLAGLIYEINKPLFQQMYDIYQEQHVDTLPAGTMILLPNSKDIEEFKK